MSLNPLICYSLRKRPYWSSALVILQGNDARWKEARLDTHDAELPIPGSGAQYRRVLRAIFLSPSDVGTDACQNRVQRLYHLNGGQDIVIVFLLKQEEDEANPMAALMTLQLSLGEFEMPVIPVKSVEDMPESLAAFHRQISTSNWPRKMASPAQTLLPFCSVRPCLSKHSVNVLTDVTSGIRDLLDTMTTPEGRTRIIDLLEDDSGGAISFWEREYMVE